MTRTLKLQAMFTFSAINMNFQNVEVIRFESNYHERLFLEAWHSTLDPNAGKNHVLIPEAYKGIARTWITWSRAQAWRHVTFNNVWQRIFVFISRGWQRVYAWRVIRAKTWTMTRESYLKRNVIREYLNACDAWFISWGMRDSWIFCVWSWNFVSLMFLRQWLIQNVTREFF